MIDAADVVGRYSPNLHGVVLYQYRPPHVDGAMVHPVLRDSIVRIVPHQDVSYLEADLDFVTQAGANSLCLFLMEDEAWDGSDRTHCDVDGGWNEKPDATGVCYVDEQHTNIPSSGTATAVANFLRYFNEQVRPALPYEIDHVYIDIWNEPINGLFGYWEADDYARYVSDTVSALKAVDPTIKAVVHVAGWARGWARTRWVHQLFDCIDWEKVDALTSHFYNWGPELTANPKSEVLCRMGPEQMEDHIVALREAIPPEHRDRVEIIENEWNIHEYGYTRRGDIVNGVSLASQIIMMAQQGFTAGMYFPFYHDTVLSDKSGTYKRIPYHVLQLFADHTGPNLVAVQVNSEVYQIRHKWRYYEECDPTDEYYVHCLRMREDEDWDEIPYITAMVTSASDRLYVILVNKDPTRSVSVSLTIDNFEAAFGTLTTVTANGYQAECSDANECCSSGLCNANITTSTVPVGAVMTVEIPPLSVSALDLSEE